MCVMDLSPLQIHSLGLFLQDLMPRDLCKDAPGYRLFTVEKNYLPKIIEFLNL